MSGRRGPYGVAEYSFALDRSSLAELLETLTQFTGVKFSVVAPESETGENPSPVSYIINLVVQPVYKEKTVLHLPKTSFCTVY